MARVLLIDGGFSTQLSEHVGDIIDGEPLWSAKFLATSQDSCLQTHRDFVRAGADIVMTNTYQASISGYKKYLKLERAESLNLMKNAVQLVRQAIKLEKHKPPNGKRFVDRKILIAGSVGPFGASLHDGSEYRGEYVEKVSREDLASWHRPRIQALVEAGVDILAFETIPALVEAEVLTMLLKEFPGQKAWLAFSCQDSDKTAYGEPLSEVATRCWDLNPDQLLAVGVNCLHPALVTPIMASIRQANPAIPLIVYPNSGEKYDVEKAKWLEKEKSEQVVDYTEEWLKLGVTYIGGCCRTNANDIGQFRTRIDNWLEKH